VENEVLDYAVPDGDVLRALAVRLQTVLPEQYRECYEDLQPASMGSAPLKYRSDGRVAWDEIWGSFCDLAMAGGPPHKGSLLEPAPSAGIEAASSHYSEVVGEICRGVRMVTDLAVNRSSVQGWVRVDCDSQSMAEWLVRAIVMENVSARCEGTIVEIPAGPDYRVEKEIKNVVTAIAKTTHYWVEHMSGAQRQAISKLFLTLSADFPLIQPAQLGYDFDPEADQALFDKMSENICRRLGLQVSDRRYAGWLGVSCPSVRSAIWMMRAMVVSNVLARREGTTLFVPVSPSNDAEGQIVLKCLGRLHRLALNEGVLP
jgi:sirohydrochlorin cobaltochelatase